MRKEADMLRLFPEYLKGEELFGLTAHAVLRIAESVCTKYGERAGVLKLGGGGTTKQGTWLDSGIKEQLRWFWEHRRQDCRLSMGLSMREQVVLSNSAGICPRDGV